MEKENIIARMEHCAVLLYQNREQEAYGELKELIGDLNQILQYMAKNEIGKAQELMNVFKKFIVAYQMNDNLALADLLSVCIPNALEE